jgi:hypothetical protein
MAVSFAVAKYTPQGYPGRLGTERADMMEQTDEAAPDANDAAPHALERERGPRAKLVTV